MNLRRLAVATASSPTREPWTSSSRSLTRASECCCLQQPIPKMSARLEPSNPQNCATNRLPRLEMIASNTHRKCYANASAPIGADAAPDALGTWRECRGLRVADFAGTLHLVHDMCKGLQHARQVFFLCKFRLISKLYNTRTQEVFSRAIESYDSKRKYHLQVLATRAYFKKLKAGIELHPLPVLLHFNICVPN
jgi:hypothetical protein